MTSDFPGLTPFGRRIKIGGYTAGGGPYRTTLFSDWIEKKKSDAKAKSDATKDGQQGTGDSWVPPIAMMAIVGYTHTQASQDASGSPYQQTTTSSFRRQACFMAGKTHTSARSPSDIHGAPFGQQDPADPFATHQWTWDNTDPICQYWDLCWLGCDLRHHGK